MTHVQGLIWFSSDGLPERRAMGTPRQACITSLRTDLLLYQSNWTAADTGDNFLSGCAGVHCDLVPSAGLTRRPAVIANRLLQSQRRGGFFFSSLFHLAAAPLKYYARAQLPRTDISSGPSVRAAHWRLPGVSPDSFPCQRIAIIFWSIINTTQRLSAEMAAKR